EPLWRELAKVSEGSFDQTVLALLFAEGPAGILGLGAKDRAACARALNANCNPAGSVSVITSADEATYSAVLGNKAIRESGILSQFLFLDVGHGAPETPALPATMELKRWHQKVRALCEERIAPGKTDYRLCQPDAQGFLAYFEFRKWVQIEKGFAR